MFERPSSRMACSAFDRTNIAAGPVWKKMVAMKIGKMLVRQNNAYGVAGIAIASLYLIAIYRLAT
jgi:hypothetical protein